MDDQRTWYHRLKDFIQLVRWWNLLIAAGGFLLSYFVWIQPVINYPSFSGEPLSMGTLTGIALVIMYMLAFGYIHNDWRDRLADRINIHNRPLVHHKISRGKIILTLVTIGIIAWLQALWIGWVLNKMEFAMLFPIIPVLLYFYNRYLKHLPLIGNILIAIFCATVPWLAWLAVPNPAGRWELAMLPEVSVIGLGLLSGFVFLSILSLEITKDLKDRAGDLAAGSRTFPIVSGSSSAKNLVIILMSLTPVLLITGIWLSYFPPAPSLIISIVHSITIILFIFLARESWLAKRKKDYQKLDKWIKWGLLIGSIDLIVTFGPWNF